MMCVCCPVLQNTALSWVYQCACCKQDIYCLNVCTITSHELLATTQYFYQTTFYKVCNLTWLGWRHRVKAPDLTQSLLADKWSVHLTTGHYPLRATPVTGTRRRSDASPGKVTRRRRWHPSRHTPPLCFPPSITTDQIIARTSSSEGGWVEHVCLSVCLLLHCCCCCCCRLLTEPLAGVSSSPRWLTRDLDALT